MIKPLISIVAVSLVVAAACKSSKSATSANTTPTKSQLTAVQAKIPDATMADLNRGHELFYGAECTKCHKPKDVTGMDQDHLQKVIGKMAKKAELSEKDREAVWRYALAVNMAGKR